MAHDYIEFHSQHGEDKWIANNIKNLPDKGFFIDIGAASAIFRNNTYHFEKNGWDGVCIDADPHWFLTEKEHEKYSPKLGIDQGYHLDDTVEFEGVTRKSANFIKCWDQIVGNDDHVMTRKLPGGYCQSLREYRKYYINIAIGIEEKMVDFCVVDRHSLSHISGSSDSQVITDRHANILQTRQIQQKTLDSIMEEYSINHIDLLSIDAEGNDIDIWNTFNHEKYSVSVLIIEHYHFDEKDFQNEINLFGKYELVKKTKVNHIYAHSSMQIAKK